MDCCNYVQPYPAHGHFYQQQQHNFCYDNTSAYGAGGYGIGGGVGGAPVSDAIEANASRYNRLSPAYPTDYVYNPKEARLRKAMREQSRELSRQTILQTAIASATGNTSVGGPGCGSNGVGDNISPSTGTGTANFLNHPLNCSASVAAATLSSLPGSPSFNAGNRIINPWFPGAHGPSTNHPKPILSPRVMTVAQHQQQQHQQQQHRTYDKTKEVLRKQAECAGAFTAASNPGYPADFSNHGNPSNLSGHQSSPHETNDYCVIAEFSDGQKWHPYQNGPSPYHSRPGGTLAKMGALHPGMQSTNQHAHTGWNQFCTVPLSTVGRTPRHMVFLQEQHQGQHCGFTDEMQMPYMQNKHMDIGRRLHPGYSQQQEHQSSKLQSSSLSPLNMSQLRESEKTIEDGPRWEGSGGGSPGRSENSMVSMMRARRESDLKIHQEQEQSRAQQQDCHQHSKNREPQQQQQQQRYSDEQSSSSSSSSNGSETAMKHHPKKPGGTKQPLPGFHQAFGSTEIGRFSRSEFFANMVGGDGSTVNLIPDGFLSASIFPFSSNPQVGICSGNSLGFPHLTTEEDILQQILPEDCIWIAQIPSHNGVTGLAEGKTSYACHDYSNRRDQQDWLHAAGSKGSQNREAGLVEQPIGAFLLRENNRAVSSAGREHRHDERPEYEINSSSTITGSVNYVVRENRGRQEFGEKRTSDEDFVEPENLSSRSRHRDSPMREESSTSK